MHCTLGDVAVAGSALIVGFSIARSQVVPRNFYGLTTITLLSGLLLTVGIEFYSTQIALRWAYADAMPTMLGIGLSPILQWSVVPLIGLCAHAEQLAAALGDDYV
jgi:hypothetical protein